MVLKDCLQRMGMDDDAQHWVDLAVREALANAIKHGNLQHPGKQVQVDLAVEGDELVIRVEDEGVGFDPSLLDDPLAPENLLRPNGRGIFYMRSFMDDIHIRLRPRRRHHGDAAQTVRRAEERNPRPTIEEGTDEWM